MSPRLFTTLREACEIFKTSEYYNTVAGSWYNGHIHRPETNQNKPNYANKDESTVHTEFISIRIG
jgi:hypothetical protein